VEELGSRLRLTGLDSMVLESNDRDVVEACRRGDPDAFRVLFETHKDRIYSIALRYSGDAAVAMDIAQETFLKLLSCIHDYRGEANFETWLYRVVVNKCLDHHRRGRRLMPLVNDFLNLIRTTGETVLHQLLRTEFEENVQHVVKTLSPEQRIVVVLRYTEGLSYEEIAGILGCSTGTVGSRLSRAHRVLERRLSHLRQGGSRA
jgi:RNA polymerase sigma-70 factor (ECF subfamily)